MADCNVYDRINAGSFAYRTATFTHFNASNTGCVGMGSGLGVNCSRYGTQAPPTFAGNRIHDLTALPARELERHVDDSMNASMYVLRPPKRNFMKGSGGYVGMFGNVQSREIARDRAQQANNAKICA